MKFFKGLFLVIVVILMIVVLLVIQVQFTIQKTLLSSSYFDKAYEAHDMESVIGEIITEQIESLSEKLTEGFSDGEAGDMVDVSEGMGFSFDIEGMIDEVWLKEQIEVMISGMLEYFTGSADVLPSIDMVPMKEMMLQVVIDQMYMFGDMAGDLSQLDEILSSYSEIALESEDGEIDKEAVELMDEIQGEESPGVDLLEIIISVGLDLDESLGISEKADAIIIEVVKDQMNYDEISDELDMNVLLNEIFADGGNPLEAVRTMILTLKTTLFHALLTLLLLLTLMVAITAFRPASILGWLSAPLIASGLIVTTLSVLEMVLFKFTNFTMSLPEMLGDSAEKVMSFVTGYVDGVLQFVLIFGIVLLVVGIIFAVLAGILKSLARKKTSKESPNLWWLTLIRVVVVLSLLVTTFFSMRSYYYRMSDDITDAIEVLGSVQETLQTGNIMEAITKSTGIDFLNFGGE